MALIKCPECGKEFSDKACNCPNCSCPTEFIINEMESDSETNQGVADNREDSDSSQSSEERKTLNNKVVIGSVIAVIIIILAILFLPKEMIYQSAKNNAINGNLIEAYDEFIEISSYKDSMIHIENLKNDIYYTGVKSYQQENLVYAIPCFLKLSNYKDSQSYLTLIQLKIRAIPDSEYDDRALPALEALYKSPQDYTYIDSYQRVTKELMDMLDFEDTKEVILNGDILQYFLEGSWETKDGYYYTVVNKSSIYDYVYDEDSDDYLGPEWATSGNMPFIDGAYYKYENGIHYVGSEEDGWNPQFKFTIKSKDEISVYNYKNNLTYVLNRV